MNTTSPNRRNWIIYIVLGIVLVVALVLWLYNFEWTGFNQVAVPNDPNYQPAKTLWSWLELLIIPAFLAGGVVWFNEQARRRQQANERDRFREEALQKYFDDITKLLLDSKTEPQEWTKSQRSVVRLRTVTVLKRLDRKRIQEAMSFLYKSNLLSDNSIFYEANLSETDFSEVDLSLINLQGVNFTAANLSEADLSGADMIDADLTLADLRYAKLNATDLTNADMSGVDLRHADLTETILSGANLQGAKLNPDDFSSTTKLPDDSSYTPATDLRRFTDPTYKKFWLNPDQQSQEEPKVE